MNSAKLRVATAACCGLCVLLGAAAAFADAPKLAEKGLCAHRGDQGVAPENTIPAFLAAIEAGAQQVEFDVKRTKDGKLVIMHDGTVDRTTNGKGAVSDLTFDEIRALDAGVKKDPKFAGTKIPTFEETLDCMPDNVILNIHLGGGVAADVVKTVLAKGRAAQSIISCNNDQDVKDARAASQDVAINYIFFVKKGPELKKKIQNAIDLKVQYVQLWFEYDAEDIEKLKDAGIKINFFGTDDLEKIKSLMKDGIDFPLVDRFSADWPAMEELGYERNVLSDEYKEKLETLKKSLPTSADL